MNLNEWINSKYLDNSFISELNKEFSEKLPFEYLSIDNFFIEEKAEKLLKALENEEYYLEDMDLYRFLRTADFKKTTNKEIIEFRTFLLSDNFIEFIEKITKSKIKRNKIDLHSLKLTNTHYLLCHDDLVEDRQFAFIFNLSKNFDINSGGELELYGNKNEKLNLSKSILPEFNQFNIFKVSSKSFHAVNEVISDKPRISFGGWYYK